MIDANERDKPIYSTFLFRHEWHSKVIGLIVGIMMLAIYVWMFAGFYNLLAELYLAYPLNFAFGAKTMVKDVIIILSSLELIRIFQSYLSIGRVKVTFIIDVALVVLIGELIGFWYREYTVTDVVLSIVIISVLFILRFGTIKYSPNYSEAL